MLNNNSYVNITEKNNEVKRKEPIQISVNFDALDDEED